MKNRHIIPIMLVLLLPPALYSGGKKEPAAQDTGKADLPYAEESLTQAAPLTAPGRTMKVTGDGLLVVANFDGSAWEFVFLDSQGKKVRSVPVGLKGNLDNFTIDCSGRLGVLEMIPVTAGDGKALAGWDRRFWTLTMEGKTVSSVDLGRIAVDGKDPWYAVDVDVDPRGTIYMATGRGLEVFGADGKAGRQIASYHCIAVETDCDGGVYAAGFSTDDNRRFVEKIDPDRGESVWRSDVGDIPYAMTLDRKAGILTVLDGSSVSRYDTAGKSLGTLIDLRDSSFLDAPIYNASFAADGGGALFFLVRRAPEKQGDPPRIGFYRVARSAQASQRKNRLTISHGYWYDRYMDAAIGAFQKKNQDTRGEIVKTFEQKDLPGSTEDALKSVMTELMAGRGADIVALRYIPYRRLVDKGILIDLRKPLAEVKGFSADAYRKNIMDACRSGDAQYVLPLSFSPKAWVIDAKIWNEVAGYVDDATWTWDDFYAVCRKVRGDFNGDGAVDRFALPRIDASSFFQQYVFPSVADQYVDMGKGTARFTDPRFVDLVRKTREFCQWNAEGNTVEQKDWNAAIHMGSVAFYSERMTGYLMPLLQREIFKADVKLLSVPSRGSLDDTCISTDLYGVNRSSRNIPKAAAFLSFLVSREMQGDPNLLGLPVHNEARSDLVVKGKEATAKGQITGTYDGKTRFTLKPLRDADVAVMDRLIGRIRQVDYTDTQLMGIMGKELKRFFSGGSTAEEACASAQEKVMTYLGE